MKVVLLVLAAAVAAGVARGQMVRVEGRVWSFSPIGDVEGFMVSCPELPDWKAVVGKDGAFATDALVGSNLTFIGMTHLWSTTQSATVTVPPGGLVGPQQEVTIQAPDNFVFDLFKFGTGGRPSPTLIESGYCHVVTTVTGKNLTLHNHPQGEADATVSIDPPAPAGNEPFYFGVFDGRTNPFKRHLKKTSEDGGAIWFNLPIPPAGVPYVVTAHKDGKVFNKATLYCTPLIACERCMLNASPPQGPRVQ